VRGACGNPARCSANFGVAIADDTEVKVWDSSAQIRWFVVPERPAGTDNLTEEELVALVTPEAMMGVALVASPTPSSTTS
jgi:nitrile hydratase subunit alpha